MKFSAFRSVVALFSLSVITMFHDVLAENYDRIQDKIIKVMNSLPVEVRRRTYAAMGAEQDLSCLKNQYGVTVANLQNEYGKILQDLYNTRKQVATAIPGFWLNCLLCNDTTAPMISNRDKPALEYLSDIAVEHINNDPAQGFVLKFYFENCDYFKKQVLKKIFNVKILNGEVSIHSVKGCDIEWISENVDLTKSYSKESLKRRSSSGRLMSDKNGSPCESFFNFFGSPSRTEEETYSETEQEIQMEYEVGLEIKNNLIPFAIDYFVGERR